MKRSPLLFVAFILLTIFLSNCGEDKFLSFSPGPADRRIAGTWQLFERRFPRDSLFSVKIDTVTFVRDTMFYVTKRYPATPPQTLTFGSDGKLSASGSEMTYYYPIKFFRLDSTVVDTAGTFGLRVNMFVTTNRANIAFQQKLEFRSDTLVIKPDCDQPCYLKFLKVSR